MKRGIFFHKHTLNTTTNIIIKINVIFGKLIYNYIGTKTDFSDNYMTLGTAPQITQNLKDFTTKSYMLMYDKHGMLAKTSQHQQLSKFGKRCYVCTEVSYLCYRF